MRKFHKDKQSEASGKRKSRDFPQISTTGSRVTQDVSMSGVQSFEPIELPFRIPNQENWYEQAEEETQLTTVIDKALEAELSANYCPSLPGSVLMIIEPVPPLVTKFPVPQDSMRHVHFCEFGLLNTVVDCVALARSGDSYIWSTLLELG